MLEVKAIGGNKKFGTGFKVVVTDYHYSFVIVSAIPWRGLQPDHFMESLPADPAGNLFQRGHFMETPSSPGWRSVRVTK